MNDNNIRVSEILDQLTTVQLNLDWGLISSALLASLLAALVASVLYRFFYERRATGSQVHRSFPLLAVSITALFICVQTSLPLSLGLLGALSIIRFRTPIKEPEEVGFIMLVIASSIAAATFNYTIIAILYALAVVILFLVRGAAGFKWLRRDGMLILTVNRAAASKALPALEGVLKTSVSRFRMESAATANETTTCQYVFSGLKVEPSELQRKLDDASKGALAGVNLYLDRAGGFN